MFNFQNTINFILILGKNDGIWLLNFNFNNRHLIRILKNILFTLCYIINK